MPLSIRLFTHKTRGPPLFPQRVQWLIELLSLQVALELSFCKALYFLWQPVRNLMAATGKHVVDSAQPTASLKIFQRIGFDSDE